MLQRTSASPVQGTLPGNFPSLTPTAASAQSISFAVEQTPIPLPATQTPTPSSLPDYSIPSPTSLPATGPGGGPPDSSALTRIAIPAIDLDTVVKYVPFDGKTWLIGGLKQEVAWMGDTSWPGLGGNTGLAGHVDLADGSKGRSGTLTSSNLVTRSCFILGRRSTHTGCGNTLRSTRAI